MKRSKQQYAPWIEDPDPPLAPMSPEHAKAQARGARRLMEKAGLLEKAAKESKA